MSKQIRAIVAGGLCSTSNSAYTKLMRQVSGVHMLGCWGFWRAPVRLSGCWGYERVVGGVLRLTPVRLAGCWGCRRAVGRVPLGCWDRTAFSLVARLSSFLVFTYVFISFFGCQLRVPDEAVLKGWRMVEVEARVRRLMMRSLREVSSRLSPDSGCSQVHKTSALPS